MVKSSATRVILNIGTLLLLLIKIDVIYGEMEINGDDLHGDKSNKISSVDICKLITCKPKPSEGDCVTRNATTLNATHIYGPQRVCCPVYSCTHSNKTITLHFGMTGMTIKKKSNLPLTKNNTSENNNPTEKPVHLHSTSTPLPNPIENGSIASNEKNKNVVATSTTTKKPSGSAEKTENPKGINIVDLDPESVVVGDVDDKADSAAVINSTVDKPQCINMKCFPPPANEKCILAPITDCELITLLGSALDCCPSYKCSSDTGDNMQFGITDGVSESVISSPLPLPDADSTPEVCGEVAGTTPTPPSSIISISITPKPLSSHSPTTTTAAPTDNRTSLVLKPFLIFDVNEKPAIIKTKKEIRYVKSCSGSGTVCFPPIGVNIKHCQKLPKETIPIQMKAFGITTACCSVWKCTNSHGIVTNHYGVSHHPVHAITFEYKGNDTERLPTSLSVKNSEPPQASTKCPDVICSPPLKHAECTVASPTALKSIKGSLRKSVKCCPIWTCKRKDGSTLTMYGRTSPSGYSKKNLQSILQGQAFTNAVEEDPTKVFSFENQKRLKIHHKHKPKHKKSAKTTTTTTPHTVIFIDEPKFSEVDNPAEDVPESSSSVQIETPPTMNQGDPMLAGVMQMQNQQMKMNQEQMRSMQQNNMDNINRMQTQQGMGPAQGQRMEMGNGMVMEMNGGGGMLRQNMQMPGMGMTQFR